MKKHLIRATLISVALSTILAYVFWKINFLPNPSSVERVHIDYLLRILFTIGSIFFVIVAVLVIYSLVFFWRRRGETGDGPPIRGSAPLEVIWTAVPLAIVLVLGSYGGIVLSRMETPAAPQETVNVNVIAARFSWQFEYPDYGFKSYTLELPVNQQVFLHLTSGDVVHSFWIPEFGAKQDAVPGMTSELRLTPNKTGNYLVRCSQLCGSGHTYMTAPAVIVSQDEFQKWVEQQKSQSQQGK